ncbi:hypothetical protein BDV98DRAFT_381765 [Pterulicium gracile]|uniref:Uncharacterized protein n=1 Tax=Pterulicium gracile TaxID=1884261 RepID=A0A5C3QP24_9AGAR|nr:hypothetical protein BDV98DRAFT_381765 [Pterula gracilis]
MEHIPPEIWADIFGLSTSREVVDFYETSHPPWVFAQVCRKWRDTAHASSELWSTIGLHRQNMEGNSVLSHLASYKLRLSRFITHSHDHTLGISLSIPRGYEGDANGVEFAEAANIFLETLVDGRSFSSWQTAKPLDESSGI